MSTAPVIASFTPSFIFPNELTSFGLPSADQQPDILNLVVAASAIIDEACGRIDGDGNGSLVVTTYVQRILLQTRNRNLIQLPMKPMVGIRQSQIDGWMTQASGAVNYYLTGNLQVNTFNDPYGNLSPIVAASGRYGYSRQDMSMAYPDLFAFINPLNLITMFGGPAPLVPVDIRNTDYDPKTGECWIPAGLQLQKYSEVVVTYNSGYDPNNMPIGVKTACACIVKNLMGKGDGTTALTAMSLSRSGANFSFGDVLDPTVDALLLPYRTVRAY